MTLNDTEEPYGFIMIVGLIVVILKEWPHRPTDLNAWLPGRGIIWKIRMHSLTEGSVTLRVGFEVSKAHAKSIVSLS